MARFRLRFLLQEFDLAVGETIIGRSPDCHITIDDPLLSRQHAKIVVGGAGASLQDLGSRNGSRVNGRLTVGAVELADGDRIRLGTQELVFFRVRTDQRSTRATGAMRLCQSCTTPFPEGPTACPHCGRPVRAEEDTMSGVTGLPVERTWIVQMLNDMLERVLRAGRTQEAEKLLLRVAEETETRLSSSELDPAQLARVGDLALQYSLQQRAPRWTLWVLDLHRRAGRALAPSAVEALHAVADLEGVRPAIGEYARARREAGAPDESLARLERLAGGS
ncbi:MAG: FHA domain-containing protein [Polyangiales bacterium]